MCISVYLGEIDFSVISALKSQISPGIDFNYLMHSKVGSHFSFSLAHVCCIFCVVLIVGTFCVGRCTRIQQQSNNIKTHSLLLPHCWCHGRLLLLFAAAVGSFSSVFLNSWSLPYSRLIDGLRTWMLVLCAQGGTRLHSSPRLPYSRRGFNVVKSTWKAPAQPGLCCKRGALSLSGSIPLYCFNNITYG